MLTIWKRIASVMNITFLLSKTLYSRPTHYVVFKISFYFVSYFRIQFRGLLCRDLQEHGGHDGRILLASTLQYIVWSNYHVYYNVNQSTSVLIRWMASTLTVARTINLGSWASRNSRNCGLTCETGRYDWHNCCTFVVQKVHVHVVGSSTWASYV